MQSLELDTGTLSTVFGGGVFAHAGICEKAVELFHIYTTASRTEQYVTLLLFLLS